MILRLAITRTLTTDKATLSVPEYYDRRLKIFLRYYLCYKHF